jgi:multidrug efflux pump subunit AcrA (membrane-fusion protein)
MFGQLALVVNRFDVALSIPESAVGFGAAGTTVFVLGEGNRAEQRPVVLGIRQQGIAQILQGLQPGERVVTEGTQKIFPGAELNPGTLAGEAP